MENNSKINNKKIIIALVGQIASGKGTTAQYLSEKHQAIILRFSDTLREILKLIHKKNSRRNMQTLSTILRKNFGENILAEIMHKNILESKEGVIILDGVRRKKDIEILKNNPNFRLISIETSSEIRYKRLKERAENNGDSYKTYEEFINDEKQEAEAEIPLIMKNADYTINNNNDFKNIYKQIEKIWKNLL